MIVVSLLGGLAAFASFLVYELRASQPMLRLDLFGRRNFSIANLQTLTIYAGLSVLFFFLFIFLQQVAGYSALQAGMTTIPSTLIMFALSRRMGALADRFGPRLFLSVGPLTAAAGILLFLRVGIETSYVFDLLPALVVFSLGLATTVAPLTATVLADADATDAGIASAINNAIARVAGLIGISAIGAVVSQSLAGDTFAPNPRLGPRVPRGDRPVCRAGREWRGGGGVRHREPATEGQCGGMSRRAAGRRSRARRGRPRRRAVVKGRLRVDRGARHLHLRGADARPGRPARPSTPAQRLRDLIEEIELADQVGLDVFGVGEHHRPDFAVSSPAVVLAAAAERTERIRLTSAVSVLSSDDPVRVFQDFATLDLLSGGRAEIMAGRGSFVESFPLFGFDLDDYDELFAEKLGLLLAAARGGARDVVRAGTGRRSAAWASTRARSRSRCRSGSPSAAPRPRPRGRARWGCPWRWRSSAACPSASPRSPSSTARLRAGPATSRRRSASTRTASRRDVAAGGGRVLPSLRDGDEPDRPGARLAAAHARAVRGAAHAARCGLRRRARSEVIEKILFQHEIFHHDRFLLQVSVGTLPHAQVMRAIELLGTEVAPAVRKELGRQPASQSVEQSAAGRTASDAAG